MLYGSSARRRLLFRGSGVDRVALDFRAEGIDGITGQVLGRGARLSADGRTLAFSARIGAEDERTDVLRVKTLDGPSRELLRVRAPESLVFQDWTPDGAALVFTRRRDSRQVALWRIAVEGGEPQPMGLTLNALRDVSVHPDGRRVTFTAGAPVLETWVIENAIR
jgi:hypothetical protein